MATFRELIAARDEGLALMNGGDELTPEIHGEFSAAESRGSVREFFLYADGWDKDSDFHVAAGTRSRAAAFHGMDDQLYGQENGPSSRATRSTENTTPAGSKEEFSNKPRVR